MGEESFKDMDIQNLGVVDQQLPDGIACEKYDIASVNDYDRKRHYHTFYEMHFIFNGSVLFDVNNLMILHNEGTVHLVRPKDHHTLIDIGGAAYYSIKFKPDKIDSTILSVIESYPHILTTQLTEKEQESFQASCEKIFSLCIPRNDMFRSIELSARLQLLLIRFLRKIEFGSTEQDISAREYGIINKAIEYVRDHYAESISLESVAAYVGLSKSYFSSFFCSVMGMTFWNYLSVYRLERARMMLVSTNESVAQIAYHCGFNSYNTFVKAFGKRYQESPTHCRNQKENL